MKQSAVTVNVVTEYAGGHSAPTQGRYVFIYHITIGNAGPDAAQLISRHWLITDANGKLDEVTGEGVIGEQPLIQPGGEYSYSSFCVLETPVGCMHGSYRMQSADGVQFDAPVAAFTLAVPGTLN